MFHVLILSVQGLLYRYARCIASVESRGVTNGNHGYRILRIGGLYITPRSRTTQSFARNIPAEPGRLSAFAQAGDIHTRNVANPTVPGVPLFIARPSCRTPSLHLDPPAFALLHSSANPPPPMFPLFPGRPPSCRRLSLPWIRTGDLSSHHQAPAPTWCCPPPNILRARTRIHPCRSRTHIRSAAARTV